MRNLLIGSALALAMATSAPAIGATPVTRAMTCPVGGESFSYVSTASPGVLGERPDGKPYSETRFPLALPECPGNGLVLYKDYSQAEIEKLSPLIASAPYLAMRETDTAYYRAYWLMRQMGEDPSRYLWALLQASWEAEGKPELRKRYLEELVAEAEKLPARPSDLQWIGMEGRAINALRELGRFDEAAARLAKMPIAALTVTVPAAGQASPQEIAQARTRRGWSQFLRQLGKVIERRDSSLEPLDLLPRRVSLGRCLEGGSGLSTQQRSFCDADTVKAEVEQLRAARTRLEQEAEALRRSRAESGR